MKTLYIYLDESGNFDFSEKGTKHFVLCAMTTFEPILTQEPLQALKYDLLEGGHDIEYFHASEDRQIIRNRVFDKIKNMAEPKFHFVYAEKSKVEQSIQIPSKVYALFAGTLLEHCFRGGRAKQINQIIVIFDRALTKKEQRSFDNSVKHELKKIGKPFRIYFHSTRSDFNGQIADYAAWSLYVKLERDESRPLNELKGFSPTIFNIF